MNSMTNQQVDDRLRTIPVIVEIKDDLVQAKEEFSDRFEKGTRRMDKIESLIKEGNEDRKRKHQQIMDKLDEEKEKRFMEKLKERDNENSKLLKEKEEREETDKKRKEKIKNRVWNFVERAFYVIIILLLSWKFGINLPM